jgi:peptidyl-prolyl cis-trans isomerase-like 4
VDNFPPMSVFVQTTLGDFVIDLYYEKCPLAARNFLELCKIKYYHNCAFWNIKQDFIAETGDQTNTGNGGISMEGILLNDPKKRFKDEFHKDLRHNKRGRISCHGVGKNANNSQFYITLTDRKLEYLDDVYTIFGQIEEGIEIIDKLNEIYTSDSGVPHQDVKIIRTTILLDPYSKETHLIAHLIPIRSPSPTRDKHRVGIHEKESDHIKSDTSDTQQKATLLEIAQDIGSADMKPPDSTLFVCKLNPITKEDDLEIIFGRFGEIKNVNLVRDQETHKSLGYCFIDFATKEGCEEAYLKMENVVIDDRRIHVDFSQSVAKLWNKNKGGHKPKHSRDEKRDDRDDKKRKFEN